MARYDITVVMTQHHHFAIEAASPGEAVARTITELGTRDAERMDMQIECELGAGGHDDDRTTR